MNKFSKKYSLLTLALLGAVLLPSTAMAQWAVDVALETSPTALERTVSAAATATSTAETAATLTQLNVYLQTGNSGNGLIPLLSSINDKLGQTNANESQNQLNGNMAARERMYDDYMIKMKADATPTQEEFKRACVDITSRQTSSQGAGAAGGASDAFRNVRAFAARNEDRFTSPAPAASRLADLVRSRQTSGYCSAKDVDIRSPGCTTAGALPNADRRASSLTIGATAGPGDPSNSSLDATQQQAALAYIENSLPQPPDLPKDAARDTAAGRAYMAYLGKFMSRLAAGRDSMTAIVASTSAIPATVGGQESNMTTNWLRMQPAWERIFGPQMRFPRAPSERDLIRFKVFKASADPNYPAELASMSEASLLKELVHLQALNARINFQTLERIEDNNKLLFQIANNQMDPMTTTSLSSLAAKIPAQ